MLLPSLCLVWAQDICLKMAFMKSVVQISSAIENLKGPGDFQFAHKATLTAIIMVSWGPGTWAAWSLTLQVPEGVYLSSAVIQL